MDSNTARREVDRLSALLRRYQHSYYVLTHSEVSDSEYDRLFDELAALEAEFPELVLPDSPTQRVGSDLSFDFPEFEHTIPVLSLDKTYTVEDLRLWMDKLKGKHERELSFMAEEKIDGVSIVLYYRDGVLDRAVTRGNGTVGNDVTPNVKTLGAVPLRLPEPVDVAVRGEIFLPRGEFERLNARMETPYANPRNLAAGTLRRIKSSEVAQVPLDIFVYEGFFDDSPATHAAVLERLYMLGFKINPATTLFTPSGAADSSAGGVIRFESLDTLPAFIAAETANRRSLEYDIDGIVIKVNEIPVRENLGYTGHHPRWAVAYKFEAPLGETILKDIDIQVGRTGRITPVARIEPVAVGGSTIRNVTLHNADYIDLLEVAPGDTVSVSRRGDVIPAVERVVEKGDGAPWIMPNACPSCGEPLSKIGAHHFCTNRRCPAQVLGRILFFIGRDQMDIESLGPETITTLLEKGFIRDIEDIYRFDWDSLQGLPGFGKKKVDLIRRGIEESLKQPFQVVLRSLGIPELGSKAAELLVKAGYRTIGSLLEAADREDVSSLQMIDGIGEKTAQVILSELRRPELRRQLEALKEIGLSFEASADDKPTLDLPQIFAGQVWCVTGSFESFKPRSIAMDEVKLRGGETTGQISGRTTHLLAGEAAGSKLIKAREAGITVVSEREFILLLEGADS